jgi:hypothetical protein
MMVYYFTNAVCWGEMEMNKVLWLLGSGSGSGKSGGRNSSMLRVLK